jgi:exosortase K
MSKMINKTAFWFVVTVATAFCLKYLHALSETHDLLIILSPANTLLEWMLGTSSQLKDYGFYFPEHDLVLNKAFSAGNFLVLSFCIFSFTTPYHLLKSWQASIAFAGMIALSYVLTVLVTTLRLGSIVMLIKIDSWLPWLTASWFLQSLKGVIYLGVLFIMYRLLKSTFAMHFKRFTYSDHYPTF